MRKLALCLALALFFVCVFGNPAAAINLVWDDSGNDASKEWSITGNWNPDNLPDGADDLFVGVDSVGANVANAANDTTIVDQAFSVSSLTVGNGADVVNSTDAGATNDFELIVNGDTVVGGAGSSILIYGGDPDGLDTDNLTINSGGSVILSSQTAQGTAVVEIDGDTGTGLLFIDAGGTLTGTGRIDLEASPGAATSLLINDGTITANTTPFSFIFPPAAGTLQITASSGNTFFDWDGSGSGVLNVNGNQTLDIDVPPGTAGVADAFSGTMNLATGSTMDVESTWSLDSGTINTNTPDFGLIIIGQDPSPGAAARIDGGNWAMTGGTITVDDAWDSLQFDSLLTASGGTINNEGTLIFNANATFQSGVAFNMNGANSSLVVNAEVNIDTPNFGVDGFGGDGSTTINAGGILDLDLGIGGDTLLDHTLNLNGGEFDITSSATTSWRLNAGAEINAAGSATSSINSAGETFIIDGEINVTANSLLNINSSSEFLSQAIIDIEAGSTLNMATVTYSGGSYTGGGTFRKGLATIESATTWNVATVDLDDGGTTVNANLTINADAIDDGTDGFDGTMTVADAAQMAVNISGGSWTVDSLGVINYIGNATTNTYLVGSDIEMNGTINHTGDGRVESRLLIGSTGFIDINTAGEPLRLSGGNNTTSPNTISGGTINGPGILGADNGNELSGFGTINADVDFDVFSSLQADNGTLTVNGMILDVGVLGTADTDGILNIPAAWNTNVADFVDMLGGELQGGTVTNDNVGGITGNGLISSRVFNNTRIRGQGGSTLVVETAGNNNDWDGTTNTGELSAFSAHLEMRDNATFAFSGTVSASNSRQVFANGFELEFEPASTLSLNGALYRSTHATDIGGTVLIGAGTSRLLIGGTTVFEATSNTTLLGDLQLDNTATRINAGATFSGAGALINMAGRTLTIADGADIDVLVQNDGTLVLGTSPGQTQGLDFEQTATGAWNVELGGTGLNDYDRMTLSNLAVLDGALNLSLIGGYVPSLADPVLTILSATSVSGTFDSVVQPVGMPAGLVFDVVYNTNSVQLTVSEELELLGDYNDDGAVDAADYVVWRKNDGTANTLPNDEIGGIIGDGQYNQWTTHFGEAAGGGGGGEAMFAAAVPEPGSALLLILGTALAGLRLARVRRNNG